MSKRVLYGVAILGFGSLGTELVSAASFTISTPSTTAQTLGSGAGQTGIITSSGSLTVGGSTVAVTISGNNATLTNLGSLTQTGTGRAIRDNTGVTGLTINNGSTTNSSALIQTADADVIQMNKTPASVVLNNYGSMISSNASAGGSQAVDFAAITSGVNQVFNYQSGLLKAFEADAVRPGVNGTVSNAGTILAVSSTGSGSDGVDVQNNSGVQVSNAATGRIEGARHGITGGAASNSVLFTTSVSNVGGAILGNDGSGINLDGFNANQTATISNSGLIEGGGVTGDGDGIDADGFVNITNTGTIRSRNSVSTGALAQSEGITVGGGMITNSGLIEGNVASGNTNALGRGITLAGVDTSGAPEPIYAGSVITNQNGGVIRGQSDSAIAVGGAASGFTVTINNNAGATLQGGGATAAAVQTGADNDTINDAGAINGASSGKAIDMGAGNNTLTITGGAASISGDINGGVGGTNAMTMSLGAGNNFAYAGSLSNFASVEVMSGNVTLSGANTYTGATVVTGGVLKLDGANRVAGSSALKLNGGMLETSNAGGANGETFASLSLTDNSILDLDMSSVSFNGLGTIGAGKQLAVSDWSAGTSPGYAFRVLGNQSTDLSFLALVAGTTINGLAAAFEFDGTYTDVRPVPLPGAVWLMLSGLGLLGGMRRRHASNLGR